MVRFENAENLSRHLLHDGITAKLELENRQQSNKVRLEKDDGTSVHGFQEGEYEGESLTAYFRRVPVTGW